MSRDKGDDDKGGPKASSARSKAGLTGAPPDRAGSRAAAGLKHRLSPLKPPKTFETLEVKDHRGVAVAFRKIAARISEDPEFGVMMAINPVLAMERYGIKLTPEMQDHVLRAVRHPPRLRTRREALEAKLTEALGTPPRVDDETWLAQVLFDRLGLEPRMVGDAQPAYRPPLNAEVMTRIKPVRPAGNKRYPGPRRLAVRSSIGMKPWKEAVRRLDLGAAVPDLPPAAERPQSVTLETAWFYKDRHELARDLVELGQIQRMAFPIRTPEAFRKIASGEQPNAFRSWITSVRFKDPGGSMKP
ncbi:hypothetical protein LJR225_002885 [Phenylobacterium sp. LjRoot225]|uniref:hypothetical protein n=1 Tax=Phenylobacterium sp. LjRoot225 TaxID=3342285 RepID=UPI003ED0D187